MEDVKAKYKSQELIIYRLVWLPQRAESKNLAVSSVTYSERPPSPPTAGGSAKKGVS